MKTKKRTYKKRELTLHLMLIPGIVIMLIFHYVPMAGLGMAFQNFKPARGLFGDQQWIGLENFRFLFSLPNTYNVLRNTVIIAVWKIILGIVVPVLVALMLNEISNLRYKRVVQTIIYFPHFMSWIILSSILMSILSPSSGFVNYFLQLLGRDPIFFLGDNQYYRGTVIVTDVLKNFGYGTIVYLAAIAGIDQTLYEAASIDGAGHLRQTWHVTLPGMRMIIMLMAVLAMGNVLNAGFDQIFNTYSVAVYESGDILDTMIYRMGLENAQFGPAAATGLMKAVISTIFISVSYLIADKCFDYRLF